MTELKDVALQTGANMSICIESEALTVPELANLAETITMLDGFDNAALRATWQRA